MTSFVDGYELRFVSHTQSAERRLNGRLIDVIPVAWVASWRNGPPPDMRSPPAPPSKTKTPPKRPPPREAFVEIHFGDVTEMESQKKAPPFVVALALARPAGEKAKRGGVAEFRGVFEVQATGVELSANSLETRVIRRVTAGEAQ